MIHKHFMAQYAKKITAIQTVENAVLACALQLLPHDFVCDMARLKATENIDGDEEAGIVVDATPDVTPSAKPRTISISVEHADHCLETLVAAAPPVRASCRTFVIIIIIIWLL